MAFNRDRNSRPGGGFRSRPSFGGRPRFGDRGDRGPVEMHKAICDNCGKECEVPFRPTSGKPVFCSNCFENKRGGSDSRSFERSEERPMFEATCADCGDSCKVPFQPSSDKPVFCSNCFGDKQSLRSQGDLKKNAGGKDEFEELNAKLDNILKLLEKTHTSSGGKKTEKKTKLKETTSIKEE